MGKVVVRMAGGLAYVYLLGDGVGGRQCRWQDLGLVFAAPVVPVHVAVALGHLCAGVNKMAGKQEVVLGGDGERVAHEGEGVDGQSARHLARDAKFALSARDLNKELAAALQGGDVQIGALLRVEDSSQRDAEVGGRAPEVCIDVSGGRAWIRGRFGVSVGTTGDGPWGRAGDNLPLRLPASVGTASRN